MGGWVGKVGGWMGWWMKGGWVGGRSLRTCGREEDRHGGVLGAIEQRKAGVDAGDVPGHAWAEEEAVKPLSVLPQGLFVVSPARDVFVQGPGVGG